MGFSKQEYWSELPFLSAVDLLNPKMEPISPAWQVDSLPLSHLGSPAKLNTSIQRCAWGHNYNLYITGVALFFQKCVP